MELLSSQDRRKSWYTGQQQSLFNLLILVGKWSLAFSNVLLLGSLYELSSSILPTGAKWILPHLQICSQNYLPHCSLV